MLNAEHYIHISRYGGAKRSCHLKIVAVIGKDGPNEHQEILLSNLIKLVSRADVARAEVKPKQVDDGKDSKPTLMRENGETEGMAVYLGQVVFVDVLGCNFSSVVVPGQSESESETNFENRSASNGVSTAPVPASVSHTVTQNSASVTSCDNAQDTKPQSVGVPVKAGTSSTASTQQGGGGTTGFFMPPSNKYRPMSRRKVEQRPMFLCAINCADELAIRRSADDIARGVKGATLASFTQQLVEMSKSFCKCSEDPNSFLCGSRKSPAISSLQVSQAMNF